jgi:hypothetical protein
MERAAAKERLDEATGQGASIGLQAACDQPSIAMTGNILRTDGCSEGPKPIRVALGGGAADTLRCLFFHGPTWDGNVPSKSGRDELVRMGLAARGNGWQWLTGAGMEACFANGIHNEKDSRESRDRQRRIRMEEAARRFLGE